MSVVAQQIQAEAGLTNRGRVHTERFYHWVRSYAVPGGHPGGPARRFRLLTVAVFGWSIFTLSSGALTWLPAGLLVTGLFFTRLLTGVCQAGVLTATIKMLGRWMPPNERSSANGVSMMGLGLGGALSPPLAVWMIGQGGSTFPFLGPRCQWYCCRSLPSHTGREWPAQHPRVNPAELALIRGAPLSDIRSQPVQLRGTCFSQP